MINPIYTDLHIHTSNNPDEVNESYDLGMLISKIKEFNGDSDFLISITDHNMINKSVYLNAKDLGINIVLGVELHIRNYDGCPAYHCHIYFDLEEITERIIDDLNSKLDNLYPTKVVEKLDPNIPDIQKVITTFDSYEFMLLPHGGQSHATFDTSIPTGVKFDTTIEKSIYYNQFDGFTARGDTGLERTQDYFKRLGINEFVNLITCSDNYNPSIYPNGKDQNPFNPTWMLAQPTFNGLRLSLSEQSRLIYSATKPKFWSEKINTIKLNKENIEIDVELTSGLNVIIGSSSSGKTLLADSIVRSLNSEINSSQYLKYYEVDKIEIDNPSGMIPHYLSQNYIMRIVNNIAENKIEDIEIIKRVFPGDQDIKEKINNGLRAFKQNIQDLVNNVKILEAESQKINKIPILSRLVINGVAEHNIFDSMLPSEREIAKMNYNETTHLRFTETLDEIETFLASYPFTNHDSSLIKDLKIELDSAKISSQKEKKVRVVVQTEKRAYDLKLKDQNSEDQTKKLNFTDLLASLKLYVRAYKEFFRILGLISDYSIKVESEEIESMGHKLFIENDFVLNKNKFIEIVNGLIKETISDYSSIKPHLLFEDNFRKQKPKVVNYDDFEKRVYNAFEGENVKKYKIITSSGKKFDDLSPGWKTSVILDIILGYDKDTAPIIIDQPEDNLATNYINKGLVNAIKKIKSTKQIILVSHNATIPMLADAQNIVLCRNVNNKLVITSNPLEGEINGIPVVDHIAKITDGGKPSIKKRVKKYNLKKFSE